MVTLRKDSTLRFDNGARHVIEYGPWISTTGTPTDREDDGQPNADATGDDIDNNGERRVNPAELFGTYNGDDVNTTIPFVLSGLSNDFQITYPAAPGAFQVIFEQVPFNTAIGAIWDDTGATPTLTVQIDSGLTTNQILGLINDPAVGSPLVAELIPESTVNDEDGVVLYDVLGNPTTYLIPGELATLQVTMDANSPENGRLYAWIDFNGNGVWDESGSDGVAAWDEQIAEGFILRLDDLDNNGTIDDLDGDGNPDNIATFTFHVPYVDIAPGAISARFRIIGESEYDTRINDDANWTLLPIDIAYSGEVEDYQFHVVNVDYGDSPVGPTLRAEDGARHVLDAGPWMGVAAPDSESDGQPDADALGDDLAGLPDENGIILLDWTGAATAQLVPGENTLLQVIVNANTPEDAVLYAWIDFNGDGDWDDFGTDTATGTTVAWSEQIAEEELILSGQLIKTISFFVPHTDIDPGIVNARFRLISANELAARQIVDPLWTLPVDTIAYTGEVEDHQFEIVPVDYADADMAYTLRIDDGARHVIGGQSLAGAPDWEYDGQPNADATGDDIDNNGGGLVDPAELFGTYNGDDVNTTIPFVLSGFANDFEITYDQAPGAFQVIFEQVPLGSPIGAFWDDTVATPTLTVQIDVDLNASQILGLINDPAIRSPLVATATPESTVDDEDGVVLLDWLDQPTTQLVPGEEATVEITIDPNLTENAYLYAWFDYNGDGDWTDGGILTQLGLPVIWNEQIADGLQIVPGTPASIDFQVPHAIDPGLINARFRLISQTEYDAHMAIDSNWSLSFDGIAYSGEVEDHQFEVVSVDYGDLPGSPTTWTDDGARHVVAGPHLTGVPDHDQDGQPSLAADADDEDSQNDGSGTMAATDFPLGTYTTIGVPFGAAPVLSFDPAGLNNAFLVTFPSAPDNFSVAFTQVASPGDPATASWDPVFYTLNIAFEDGVTTTNELLAAINGAVASPVSASLDDDFHNDDEEGVSLENHLGRPNLIPGEMATVYVTAAAGTEDGLLFAWLDFDGDNVWGESGTDPQGAALNPWNEQIANLVPIASGETVPLSFHVPHDVAGTVNARFPYHQRVRVCRSHHGSHLWRSQLGHSGSMTSPTPVKSKIISLTSSAWTTVMPMSIPHAGPTTVPDTYSTPPIWRPILSSRIPTIPSSSIRKPMDSGQPVPTRTI